MSDIFTTAQLKEYILRKLANADITENEISSYIFFSDKCNCLGNFVYCKKGKYCFSYMGFRASECITCKFDTKEELLIQVIKCIARFDISIAKSSKKYNVYALELAIQIDDSLAESMKIE